MAARVVRPLAEGHPHPDRRGAAGVLLAPLLGGHANRYRRGVQADELRGLATLLHAPVRSDGRLHVREMLAQIGPRAHVVGVCQPGPPVLAAAAQQPHGWAWAWWALAGVCLLATALMAWPARVLADQPSPAASTASGSARVFRVRDFGFASSRKFIWDAMGAPGHASPDPRKPVMAMSFYPKEGEPLSHGFIHPFVRQGVIRHGLPLDLALWLLHPHLLVWPFEYLVAAG